MPISAFGRLMKSLRQKTGKTMRDFCLEHKFDPGNYSRLEQGNVLSTPKGRISLEKYATALRLVRRI